MDRYRRLAELMKGFQLTGQMFFPATVESVEGNTCTINVGDLSISDVRLKPSTDKTEDDLLLTPSVGANVLVGSLSGDYSNLCILQSDAISEAYLKVGKMTFKMDKNGIVMNDGLLDGLVIVGDLIGKLNAIEKTINELKTVFSTWVPVSQDGGAALKSKVQSWASQTIKLTTVEDVENKDIKQ